MSAAPAAATENVSSPGNPYVGLRPYERHEGHLFFGRERDATLLCDKIFSARLTLYYGPSGVGKSSILKTLVVPLLEQEEARAIYFDDWRGAEPTAALKARLVVEATEAGIPSAGAGAPSLSELAALISTHTQQTVTLILDQFEEFLTVHGQHLDPLRRELGALVRTPNADVRVVLSLRQEFLASLEPFRHEILTLFESTYRLEPLDDKAVREAIERPAQRFGKGYDPELVDLLIEDVREGAPADSVGPNAPKTNRPVDLPTMQLVCSELWMAAQKKGDAPVLTRELYEAELGGKDRVLANYVKNNMPRGWSDRCVTATLMRFLAPPSGLKAAYSVEDLAQYTAASRDRVQVELSRLATARILRTRGVRSEELFELQHDAFIGIIAPWRDNILRRAAIVRRAKQTVVALIAVVAVAALVIAGELFFAERRELSRHLQALAELEQWEGRAQDDEAGATFEKVTTFLLDLPPSSNTSWRGNRMLRWVVLWPKGNLETLKELLARYEGLLPERYGLPTATDLAGLPAAPDSLDWPLALEYSADGILDEEDLKYTWDSEATTLMKDWGIPVPRTLLLRSDPELMPAVIRLTGPELQAQQTEIPSFVKEVFIIAAEDIPDGAREFVDRFSSDRSAWTPFTANGKSWWIVPRWSLPIWRTCAIAEGDPLRAHQVTNRSGFAARLLAEELRRRPEVLLVPQAVEELLRHVGDAYPQTLAEARAARGDRLRQDLVEVVRQGRPIAGDLPQLLDALARYPDEESHRAAALIVADVAAPYPRTALKARGPWGLPRKDGTLQLKVAASSRAPLAYAEALTGIPIERRRIRVELGYGLVTKWRSGETELAPALVRRIDDYREGFTRTHGLTLPGIGFSAAARSTNADMGFRVEVLGDTQEGAPPVIARQDDPIGTLMETVGPRVATWRANWLGAEDVAALLESVEPALGDWLRARYSLTDLKLLFRAVLVPTPQSPSERSAITDGNTAPVLAEQTLRYQNWLMRSLLFWSCVGDPSDIPLMAHYLRDTQRRRLNPGASAPTSPAAASVVEGSIQSLVNGKFEAAERGFSRAIASDRRGAIEAFLALYPGFLPSVLVREFGEVCEDAPQSPPNVEGVYLIDLEEAVRDPNFAKRIDAESARKMMLCVLATYDEFGSKDRLALARQVLDRYSTVDASTAGEASWLARQVLTHDDLVINETAVVRRAADLLRKTVRFLPEVQRVEIVDELLNRCASPGPRNLCWTLASDVAAFVDDFTIQLRLVDGLARRQRKDDLRRGIEAADRAAELVERTYHVPGERQVALDAVLLCRSTVLIALGQLGDDESSREAEDLLVRLLASPTLSHIAEIALASIRQSQGRYTEAKELLTRAESAGEKTPYLYSTRFNLQLELGDASGAAATSDEVVELWEHRPADERLDMQYLGALGKLLTNIGGADWLFIRQFLETTHEYVPYVALMHFASMAEKRQADAPDLIRKRWSQARPGTWEERLREGDDGAWREMLLGYYIGEIRRVDLFEPLEDEVKYAASPLRELPLNRLGLLTEAYFYDALLAQAKGDSARRLRSLEEVIRLNQRQYFEYSMAKFLLQRARAGTALPRRARQVSAGLR